MPISTNGNFIFAEPGDGRTVLSMDGGEFNLFGKYTAIKTTAVDTFNTINDFMIEKKVEDPKTFQLIVGIGVTVVLGCLAVGAVAVAAGLTGGLALTVMGAVAAGFTRAAIETGIYTATSFLTDTVTNSHKSNKDFMQGLAISGGFGFVTGAFSYLNPTISFTPGPSLALEGGGTMAAAMPIIVTNVADTVLVLNKSLAISTVLSAAMGGGGKRDKEGIQFNKNNGVPVKEKTTASNGLDYQSNSKHTPGQPGNRPDAGIEPRNSLELFEKSTPSVKKPNQRFTLDKNTNTLHRFYNDGNGTWHWSGSTNQGSNSLKGSQVPNDIKKSLKLPMKGW